MVFFGGFHAAMHHGHVIVREHVLDLFKTLFQSMQVKFLVFLDERIDDISLTALFQLPSHKLIHLEAVGLMPEDGCHRLASRRQLVNDRDVQVAIDRHGQRPGDWGGCHDQHMGRRRAVLAPQAGTLRHAKAVLLVDDGEAKIMELHRVLDEGMGAYQYLQLTVHQCLVDGSALAFACRARQEGDLHANGIGHRFDGFQMLSCQDLGGCHNAGLITVIQCDESGHKGDNRLAAAHIALQQAVHLLAATHVTAHLADNTFLRPGKRKLQHIMIKAVEICAHIPENVSHQPAAAALDVVQDVELQEKQFLELEPQLRTLQRLLVGRHMDVAQCLGQRHEAETMQQVGWQSLTDVLHRWSLQQGENQLVYGP